MEERNIIRRSAGRKLALLIAVLIVLLSASQGLARGTYWTIDQSDSPDANGTITITVKIGPKPYNETTADVSVTAGMSKEAKAEAISNALDAKDELQSSYSSGQTLARFEVDDTWIGHHYEIEEVTYQDNGTGEDLHVMKDDVRSHIPIVDVTLQIAGTGTASGWYALSIGSGDTALVNTTGLSGSAIETALITEFNDLYGAEFVASLSDGKVTVSQVPCPYGVVFGTNDTGLSYSLAMRRTDIVIPSVTDWGLIVLVLLVLASGVWVVIRRRKTVRIRT
jgi:hypothetical protein